MVVIQFTQKVTPPQKKSSIAGGINGILITVIKLHS